MSYGRRNLHGRSSRVPLSLGVGTSHQGPYRVTGSPSSVVGPSGVCGVKYDERQKVYGTERCQ